jgi:hypothetical protein
MEWLKKQLDVARREMAAKALEDTKKIEGSTIAAHDTMRHATRARKKVISHLAMKGLGRKKTVLNCPRMPAPTVRPGIDDPLQLGTATFAKLFAVLVRRLDSSQLLLFFGIGLPCEFYTCARSASLSLHSFHRFDGAATGSDWHERSTKVCCFLRCRLISSHADTKP